MARWSEERIKQMLEQLRDGEGLGYWERRQQAIDFGVGQVLACRSRGWADEWALRIAAANAFDEKHGIVSEVFGPIKDVSLPCARKWARRYRWEPKPPTEEVRNRYRAFVRRKLGGGF